MREFDAIVLGAGAAGLMCAIAAGQRGKRVLLLDHAPEPGRKILISGGGRCNFTNLQAAPDRYLSANPHFCRSALARYTQHDFLALVRRHGIAFHEKTLGQLFCDGSAKQIVAMLLAEADAAGVDLRVAQRVIDIARDTQFRVQTDRGAFAAAALVLATGGPSIPKLGATGFAYDVARRFGLPVVEPRPALVPLTFAEPELALMRPLSGVSLETVAAVGKRRFREAMLFTHRGLSGPAILQISSYWAEGTELTLDLLPDRLAGAVLKQGKRARPNAQLRTLLSDLLPQRLALALAEQAGASAAMAGLRDAELERLGERLNRWRLTPSGTEGFAKAEVTSGGVDTTALSSQTMQARDVPGLFVIGEAVDVTGWLGGYNFQWAWSSGWVAGQSL